MKYERTERERSECLEPPFDGDNREPFADAAPAPSRRLSWGLRLLLYMMSGLRIGRLDIVLPDGSWRRHLGHTAFGRSAMAN
jgi:hypothetical protein